MLKQARSSIFRVGDIKKLHDLPEAVVIKEFHAKVGGEKLLSSCLLNLPHFPYSFRRFPQTHEKSVVTMRKN